MPKPTLTNAAGVDIVQQEKLVDSIKPAQTAVDIVVVGSGAAAVEKAKPIEIEADHEAFESFEADIIGQAMDIIAAAEAEKRPLNAKEVDQLRGLFTGPINKHRRENPRIPQEKYLGLAKNVQYLVENHSKTYPAATRETGAIGSDAANPTLAPAPSPAAPALPDAPTESETANQFIKRYFEKLKEVNNREELEALILEFTTAKDGNTALTTVDVDNMMVHFNCSRKKFDMIDELTPEAERIKTETDLRKLVALFWRTDALFDAKLNKIYLGTEIYAPKIRLINLGNLKSSIWDGYHARKREIEKDSPEQMLSDFEDAFALFHHARRKVEFELSSSVDELNRRKKHIDIKIQEERAERPDWGDELDQFARDIDALYAEHLARLAAAPGL